MAGESRRQRLRELLRHAQITQANVTPYEIAFIHESAVRENIASQSNERLEFLGDAVLGFIVARWLFEQYPDVAEGELALRKSAIVSDTILAETAQRLDFGAMLVLGQGLANLPPARKRSTLSDAFEAFVAVLAREAGLESAAKFVITQHIEPSLPMVAIGDPKTTLQEWAQKHHALVPVYRDHAAGPAHERRFTSSVSINGDILASGEGASKKTAQRAAAAHAIEILSAEYPDLAPRVFSEAVAVSKNSKRS